MSFAPPRYPATVHTPVRGLGVPGRTAAGTGHVSGQTARRTGPGGAGGPSGRKPGASQAKGGGGAAQAVAGGGSIGHASSGGEQDPRIGDQHRWIARLQGRLDGDLDRELGGSRSLDDRGVGDQGGLLGVGSVAPAASSAVGSVSTKASSSVGSVGSTAASPVNKLTSSLSKDGPSAGSTSSSPTSTSGTVSHVASCVSMLLP